MVNSLWGMVTRQDHAIRAGGDESRIVEKIEEDTGANIIKVTLSVEKNLKGLYAEGGKVFKDLRLAETCRADKRDST